MKKLGKYEVLGELGHGAMGVVYRARDPIINRLVALKTITTGVADDPAMLQRFYREAQSAGGLQHPNIVTIYDMGEAASFPYIAMELVEGENLEQLIARRSAFPTTLKLAYAIQSCRAFDYAHKRGIVHRDIKPGNIMVSKDGTVKVVDFGIARVSGNLAHTDRNVDRHVRVHVSGTVSRRARRRTLRHLVFRSLVLRAPYISQAVRGPYSGEPHAQHMQCGTGRSGSFPGLPEGTGYGCLQDAAEISRRSIPIHGGRVVGLGTDLENAAVAIRH